jgi:hypothetical protein
MKSILYALFNYVFVEIQFKTAKFLLTSRTALWSVRPEPSPFSALAEGRLEK